MPSLASANHALVAAGYDSSSVANQQTGNNVAGQFDTMLASSKRLMFGLNTPRYIVKATSLFTKAMFTKDIYHTFFTGGILGNSPLRPLEFWLWRMSGGKHIVFAYGQDGFVYKQFPDMLWADALKETYPRTKSQDQRFEARIASVSKTADCVIGCIVHTITLPRVDVWPVLWYPPGNIGNIEKSADNCKSNVDQVVKIAHPSNHRNIKGTDALISAVESLRDKGLNLSLDVIENVNIVESRRRMQAADIVVDQLLMGYAMTAIEALAFGKVVISGFDETEMYAPFYENSYLRECPIVKATPSSIEAVIEELYHDRSKRMKLAKEGSTYFVQHHSDTACISLFESVYEKIWYNKNINLEGLFVQI